jgi:tRNA-dihydrouridine synthase
MGFSGQADWETIAQVKAAVSIPVIGNGDIRTPEDARRMLEDTGCDLAMIGRGALGNPWIFRRTNLLLRTGDYVPEPDLNARMGLCIRHLRMKVADYGERTGVREMRKHVGWYTKGLQQSAALRREVFRLERAADVERALMTYLARMEKMVGVPGDW